MPLLRLMLIPLTMEEEAALGPEPPSQARAQQALYRLVANAPPGSALSARNSNESALFTLALTAEHRRALTLPTGYREREDDSSQDSEDSSDSEEDSDTTSTTDSDEDSEQMSATASEEEEDPELRATYAGEMEPVSSNDSEEEEEREEASLGIEE